MGIYLNCGSGQRPFQKPWINVEVQEKWRVPTLAKGCDFTLGDASRLPLRNFEVDVVVGHHIIEHFSDADRDAFIDEAYRVLRIGGSLLIFAPNLRTLAQRWLTGQLSTPLYTVNLYGAWMDSEHDRHKWGWDPASLKAYLQRWPWAQVKPFDFRRLPGSDYAAHDFWIQEWECVK